MFEYYFDQGTGEQYKVHTYNLEKFKADFPEAYRIEPFDEEVPLPQITGDDVKVTENKGIKFLKRRYEGLGYEFKPSTVGMDRIEVIAPADKNGFRRKETFEFDKGLFNSDFSLATIIGGTSPGEEADRFNAFIQDTYLNGEIQNDIDASIYAKTIKYSKERPIIFKNQDGSTKTMEELSAEELEQRQLEIYTEMFQDENVWEKVLFEIDGGLKEYTNQQVDILRKKYDFTNASDVEQFNTELTSLIRKKQEELINESYEYKRLKNSINSAVTTVYGSKDKQGSAINEKYVLKAEGEILPIASALRKIPLIGDAWADMSHGVGVGRIQIGKGFNEMFNISLEDAALKSRRKELETLKEKINQGADPNEEYKVYGSPVGMGFGTAGAMTKDALLTFDGTIATRIKELEEEIPKNLETIQDAIVSSVEYQDKISSLDPAKIFDKGIFDVDVTVDEWQRMLGTQGTQMLASIFVIPTIAQETGGITTEIINVEAARKTFPNVYADRKNPTTEEDSRAIDLFNGLKADERVDAMFQVVNNGEVNLDPAFAGGTLAGSLDLISNFFVIGKATKFLPKSVVKEFLKGNFLKVLKTKTGRKALGEMGKNVGGSTFVEMFTESLQEKIGFESVEFATGYGGKPEENVKRMLEGAGQAMLTTPFFIGAGQTTRTGFQSIKSRIYANPKQTKFIINQEKQAYEKAYQDGNITYDAYIEVISELDAVEDAMNTITKFDKMEESGKENVIKALKQQRILNIEKAKIVNEQKKDKEKNPGAPSFYQKENNNKLNEINKKINDEQIKINKELLIYNYFQDGRLTEYINRTTEGDFKGKQFKRFTTKKQFLEYFQKVFSNDKWYDVSTQLQNTIENYINRGFSLTEAQNKAFEEFSEIGGTDRLFKYLDMKLVYDNNVNAALDGDIAVVIDDNIIENIKKGDPTSTNAIHHEGLHMIQANMDIKRLREIVDSIENELSNTKDPKLKKVFAYAQIMFEKRYGKKLKKTQKKYYKEWMTNLSDAMKYFDAIDITQNGSETMFNIGKIFGNIFKSQTQMNLFDWSSMDGTNALAYIKKWNNFRGVSSDLNIRIPRGKVNTEQEDKKQEERGILASEIYNEINETFLEYVDVDKELAANMTADMMQGIVFDRLIRLKNAGLIEGFSNKDLEEIQLQFTGPRDGLAESLKNRGAVGLLMKFETDFKGGVMGYFNATIRGRKMLDMRLQEFVEKHPRYGNIQVSIEQEGVTRAVETQQDTRTPEDILIEKQTPLEKDLTPSKPNRINVLKIGKNRTSDKILNVVKVKEGDTFKQVQDNNVEAVTNIVFKVPAKKITNPAANLTYAKKITDGIPEPSEAGNIQDYYSFEPALTSEIRVLPKTNVTSEQAFTNLNDVEVVSKAVKGRSIGLKNNVLNYFYDKKFKPDGKRARSKGKTSQVPLWQLKDKFINPSAETIRQTQREFFGITPVKELNLYNRTIGQNLKGFANFTVNNKSLSAAQRILADIKADPQKIADITAAQSPTAFSELALNLVNELFTEGSLDPNFNMDLAGISKLNTLLTENGEEATIDYKKVIREKDGIKTIVDSFKRLMTIGPKEMWFGQNGTGAPVFTTSNSDYGVRMSSYTQKDLEAGEIPKGKKVGDFRDPEGRVLFNRLKDELKKIRDDKSYTNYGKQISGVTDYSVSTYNTLLKNKNKKDIEKFNATVALIHDALWTRIHKFIGQDKSNATIVGNYLKLVANDKNHWHKLGAQFVGYSLDAKKVEFEHAMPATAAYLYLLDSSINRKNFAESYKLVIDNYKLIALDKVDDTKLRVAKLARNMPVGWKLGENFWWQRYFNDLVDIDPNSIVDFEGVTFAKKFNIKSPIRKNIKSPKILAKSISKSRLASEVTRGITILDFDDTLATTQSLVRFTAPDGTTGTLNAEQYASTYQDLQEQGYTFDFSEFNKVVGGKIAPLFQKALKLQGKFGPNNMFVLTARPPQAQKAIFDFLKANGLNIPLKNITGLGNSTAEAKALWVADKAAQGYNDFYFADDALQNVQAVDNILEQFDVKRKVQQARTLFSETLDPEFNKILEEVTGIEADKRFSAVKARRRGQKKGKFRFFIPPSHEDFVGLLYNFMGKGALGNKHRDFFEQALVKPLNRAFRELNAANQSIANDYAALNKQYKDVKKKLGKKTPDGDFTFEDAIRIYLWDKHGYKIEGLSQTDQTNLVNLVKSDPELQRYADQLNVISKQDNYVEPTESWEAGDIRTDLTDATGRIGRAQFFQEFFNNADIIFSQENLNKIEAAYGASMVSAIKDMLYRIKTGRNRPSGQSKHVNMFMNWLNGSVASTMFFNIRSMVLQQMSMVNFINFGDNNIYRAAKAFSNQKQFWTDWAFLFNSDFMKQRRGGIMTDVNGAELAASVKNAKNPVQAVIKKLLQLGFLPTQIGDNLAIATGGATFYRNRVNKYLKDGLSQAEAESKAFIDFQIIAEATQQSARPDMVSQQQASALGKVILAFQNVTSQFNRLAKKSFLDLKNRRITPGNATQFQSDLSNISRIAYYLALQNLIFYSLQTALFAAIFDDDEEDEKLIKKKEYAINGAIDSVLRGAGVMGSVAATLKNMARIRAKQQNKDVKSDPYATLVEGLNVSPPLGIKARKIVQAEKDLIWNRDDIEYMETFDIENPVWPAYTSYIEGLTNVPVNRLYRKTLNVRESLDNQHSAFQRALMFSGWSKWNLDIPDTEIVKKPIKKKHKYVDPY